MLAIDLASDAEQIAVFVIGALIVAAIVGGVGFARALMNRIKAQDAAAAALAGDIAVIRAEQARNFGPNGNGIRQAVNGLTAGQTRIEKRLDAHLEAHSENR